MKNFLLALFKHHHKWVDSAHNCYFVAIEQKCKCGARQYHLWGDIKNGKPKWRDGKHPLIKH